MAAAGALLAGCSGATPVAPGDPQVLVAKQRDSQRTPAIKQNETVLYSFASDPDGAMPQATLVEDAAGHLFGTTSLGGTGSGAVFELTRSGNVWTENVIHAFGAGSDGSRPGGGLSRDDSGALYGTTSGGGAFGGGTVFKLTPGGSAYGESVIYSFAGSGNIDGSYPNEGVLLGRNGTIFGTAASGGTNERGVVFRLQPGKSGYAETVIYNFPSPGPGPMTTGRLIADSSGALYGTSYDQNLVYKLTPNGSGYSESNLHVFAGGNDGALPEGSLTLDATGSLYGTTLGGGGKTCTAEPSTGCGIVFKLTPLGSSYAETILYAFSSDQGSGCLPAGGVIFGKRGVLYGTTETCGDKNGPGIGTVFALTPAPGGRYTESGIHDFNNTPDGNWPQAGLTMMRDGALAGTTFDGGTHKDGTVFEVRP
jgi:uncharacterized repeat protein (TIGR03803 family)